MAEAHRLVAAWPKKNSSQFQSDRAVRTLGRDGQGLALWQLTELLMAAQHGEFDLRVNDGPGDGDGAAADGERAAEGSCGAKRKVVTPLASNPLPCLCVRPTCRAAHPLPAGGLPGNDGPGGAETPTGRSAGHGQPTWILVGEGWSLGVWGMNWCSSATPARSRFVDRSASFVVRRA